jgi:ribonuclease P protein component
VLAQANRVVRGDDYRATVRGGYRTAGPHVVTFVRASAADQPTRFGFIVSKTVGNAVTRNLVRRRLKAVCFDELPQHPSGKDIVIRALPASADAPWSTLQKEIHDALTRGVRA